MQEVTILPPYILLSWTFVVQSVFMPQPFPFLCPAVIMAGALSDTPVRTYVRNYVRLSRRRPLSNSNIIYQKFMKLSHIVSYHNVFFKFDNGLYRTRLSRVMALCLWKFTVLNNVRSLTQIFFIRILWNLVTLFGTIMSSSSSIMVYIAFGFQELWPFVYQNSPF